MSTSAAQQGRNQNGEYNILDSIIAETRLSPDDEAYDIAKRGVSAFIEELLKPQNDGEPVKKAMVDRMIAEIDAKLSTQMDEILHHPDFQALESAWRGLQLLVDRTNFRENIKIEILSVSKQDLLDDFEDSPEVMQSGLYKHIYTAEYGQFGGQPVGAIIANYYMSPSSPDVKLMQYVSSVACMAHAPFVAAAGPKFFGLESFTGLPDLKDLKDHFEGPQFAKWQSFRQSEDSRYVALTVPRFLLRTPYDPEENPVKSFAYKETVANSHEHYLWGNTAYAFGTKLTDSFAKYRWCPNIIGAAERRCGGGPAFAPLREHGRDRDQDPHRGAGVRSPRVRTGRGRLHFPDHAQGQRQRRVLLRQLGAEAEVLRHQRRRQGRGAELQARHPVAVHDDRQPPGPLPEGPATRTAGVVEGAYRPRAGAEQVDPPVRRRPGKPQRRSARPSPAARCTDHRQ